MKRELKFRVKNDENNWIYFTPIHNGIDEKKININTISQYTGMKDKNGVEIYEGDILKSFESVIGIVEYNYGKFFADEITTDDFLHYDVLRNDQQDIEVIGNIYDNPELLKA